jgi:hypothetical protein
MFRKIVSFNATIDTKIEDVNKVYEQLSQLALDTAHLTEHVMVSTYDYVDKPDEGFPGDYYNEMTLFRVYKALRVGFDEYSANEIIRILQEAGVLFREQKPEPGHTGILHATSDCKECGLGEKNLTLQDGVKDDKSMQEYLLQEYNAGRMVIMTDAVSKHPKIPNEMLDLRPHSRACGIADHSHGKACSENCPSCGGKDEPLYKLPEELNPNIKVPPMYNT